LVKFGGPWNGKCCHILWSFWIFYCHFGILYGRFVQFVVIWYIFPVLVCLDQETSGNPGHSVETLILRSSWDLFLPLPFVNHYKDLSPGMPDGTYSCIPKSQIWYSWEVLGTENLGKYNGHLCSTLWLFVIFTYVIAIKFFPVFVHTYIHMLFQENSGNPVFHSLIIRKSFRVSLKQLISSIASSLRLSHPYASLFTYLDANPFVCMLAKFSANLR
jgi:hypothetical protein